MGDWERHRKLWWIVLLTLVFVTAVVTLVVRIVGQPEASNSDITHHLGLMATAAVAWVRDP